jgi:hypothetical protein
MRELSKPQIELLRSLAVKPAYVAPYHRPLQALLRRGFVAEVVLDRYRRSSYVVTDAGRAYLEQHPPTT